MIRPAQPEFRPASSASAAAASPSVSSFEGSGITVEANAASPLARVAAAAGPRIDGCAPPIAEEPRKLPPTSAVAATLKPLGQIREFIHPGRQ